MESGPLTSPVFIIADEELISRHTCALGKGLDEGARVRVRARVGARQVGDRRETVNDSHVR